MTPATTDLRRFSATQTGVKVEQEILYPKYFDAVRFAVQRKYYLLRDKGRITGRRFASLIRERCNMNDPMNVNAAELAEEHIDNIELTQGGKVRWQFK